MKNGPNRSGKAQRQDKVSCHLIRPEARNNDCISMHFPFFSSLSSLSSISLHFPFSWLNKLSPECCCLLTTSR